MAKSQTKPVLQLTRKGLCVWGGLVFFVMGWMFILGILVGRGTAPIPLKTHELEKELQALKATVLQEQQDEITARVNRPGGDAPAAELGFYEALKKPPAKTQRRIAPPPKPAQKPAPQPKKPEPPKPAPAASPKPAPSVPPTVAAKPALQPKPEATRAPATKGRFTIQVGSFKEAVSANALVSQLRSKGLSAYQLRTEVPGKGTWYRVRVGAFDSRSDAESSLAKLNGDKIKGMIVATP